MLPQSLQRVRPNPGLPGHSNERLQVEGLHLGTGNLHRRWQAQWFDADQSYRQRLLSSKTQASFQYRGDGPATLAQRQVQRLVETLGVSGHQLPVHCPCQHRAGTSVVTARLAVQCLDAGPQRSRQPQTGEDTEKLHAMAPPMTEQRLQSDQQRAH
ncbi:hypothetical protein D3C79_759230 [compost metagenome]